jgi:histidyl-tRNA synthetase
MTVKLDAAPPRGMKDVLPAEVELRDQATSIILATYIRYGFRRVETPALESLRLLVGSGGGENEKLIYKILKRGAKLDAATAQPEDDLADLGLRFDLTVPLTRYYAQNRAALPDPFKAIQIGPVWRAERPQKGRFRQFTQCDIDILGVASEIAEIELILATSEALIELGLERPRIRLNDRRILTALASFCGVDPSRHGGFFVTLDKLDKIGRDGVERELREAGHDESAVAKLFALFTMPGEASSDSALDKLALTIGTADEAVDGLRTILRTVEREVGGRSTVAFDPSLVRGMGYYTGPIFEAAYGDSTSSIAGGGRYDRMVGRLLGHDVPACGFSIGFERVISILEARRGTVEPERERVALLFGDGDPLPDVVAAAAVLRRAARIVSLTQKRKNLARQLDDLAGEGFGSYAVFRPGQSAAELKPLVRRAPDRGAAGA